MCWGNNGTTIYALDKDDQALITFEETLVCASNPELKLSLRSKFVQLMTGEWTGMAARQKEMTCITTFVTNSVLLISDVC